MPNTLFYGDNLQVLREHVPDDSVGLVSRALAKRTTAGSKFSINVRLSVQHKCHPVGPRWYQVLVPEELRGFAASADSRRRYICQWR